MKPQKIIKMLEENGYVYSHTRGTHKIYKNQERGQTISVPVHRGKDINKPLALRLLKIIGSS